MLNTDVAGRLQALQVALANHTGNAKGIPVNNLPHPNMHISSTYTITNGTTDRTYDANATSTDELADILYTLIQDLKTLGILE